MGCVDNMSLFVSLTDKGDDAGCITDNGGCEQNCTDLTDGGHLCHCDSGYIANKDDKTSCLGMRSKKIYIQFNSDIRCLSKYFKLCCKRLNDI